MTLPKLPAIDLVVDIHLFEEIPERIIGFLNIESGQA
jgi:hypothetical protein